MILISFFVTLLYAVLILSFIIGFDRVPIFKLKKREPKIKFSIIVPFRDEATNLPQLLHSIQSLKYPSDMFEVLFINDQSKDSSSLIVEEFKKGSGLNVSLLDTVRISLSPKKDAITTAIKQARYDWILTTDADCVLPVGWLQYFNEFIEANKVDFVCGPINHHKPKSFLDRFQQLEILSLLGATIGAFGIKKPFMCNGANMGYSKAFFSKVSGFYGNSHIASGDDIFMLEKALKHNGTKVAYLKSEEASVLTHPTSNLKGLVHQHIRWASKSTYYKNSFGKLVGLLIFLMNALIVCLFVLSILQLSPWRILLYCFVVKFYCDFWLILKAANLMESRKSLTSYLLCSLLYPFFSVYITIKSIFGKHEWKGRRYG